MAQNPKTQYADIEAKLGQPIATFVAALRSEQTSWRRIAIELTSRTGIDVTGETVRVWSLGKAPRAVATEPAESAA